MFASPPQARADDISTVEVGRDTPTNTPMVFQGCTPRSRQQRQPFASWLSEVEKRDRYNSAACPLNERPRRIGRAQAAWI